MKLARKKPLQAAYKEVDTLNSVNSLSFFVYSKFYKRHESSHIKNRGVLPLIVVEPNITGRLAPFHANWLVTAKISES
uniref:Uncharacterized protein n=1 Tax=Amphimedon queenslandica TaxID=400682 RepID=A0A1X7T2G3_AMPQE